ncbi:MAG: GUN4 domain-containing protein [Synechococcales bacterium]|nr:GUN4 domain-containing protein [Synechococcales bacterium]
MVHLSSFSMGILTLGTLSVSAVSGHWQQSEVGMNYQSIEQLLTAQKWEAAAQETEQLIFEIARRRDNGTIGSDLLIQESVTTFPCKDLQTLDHLWRKHSRDRFGFTIQTQIWQKVQPLSPSSIPEELSTWSAFTQQVGWQAYLVQSLREEAKPSAAITDVPKGTFPLPVRSTGDFGNHAVTEEKSTSFGQQFLKRVAQCQLAKT